MIQGHFIGTTDNWHNLDNVLSITEQTIIPYVSFVGIFFKKNVYWEIIPKTNY